MNIYTVYRFGFVFLALSAFLVVLSSLFGFARIAPVFEIVAIFSCLTIVAILLMDLCGFVKLQKKSEEEKSNEDKEYHT